MSDLYYKNASDKYLTIRLSEHTYSQLKVISAITNIPMTTLFASMIETPVFQKCLDMLYNDVLNKSKANTTTEQEKDKESN